MILKNKKHPWNKWFNWKQYTLRQGRHFTGMAHSMAQQIRNKRFAWDAWDQSSEYLADARLHDDRCEQKHHAHYNHQHDQHSLKKLVGAAREQQEGPNANSQRPDLWGDAGESLESAGGPEDVAGLKRGIT